MPDPMSSTLNTRVRRPGAEAELPPAEGRGRVRRLWPVLPVCAGFAVFGVIVWLAYQDASLGPPIGEPPLIKAAAEPIKLPPEQADEATLAAEEGAIGRLWSDDGQGDQPERLLPPPEQPLSPPTIDQPALGQMAPEPPAAQPPSDAAADLPSSAAGGADEASGGSLHTRSSAAPTGVPASAPMEQQTDESLHEAEAALDRLLAEVTAPSEDTDAPGRGAAAPAAEEPAIGTPPERPDGRTGKPANSTGAALTSDHAAPASPPAKPTAEAPGVTGRTSTENRPARPIGGAQATEVRPARPIGGAPATDGQASERPTQTAALTAGPPISAPPVVPGGEFRIQLAAVRGEEDARRAWNLFMGNLGPVLSDIEPIFERAETANGVFYRIQIGPYGSQEAAESLCEQLKQRNASCFVIRR